ncbi:MAG TPA: alpha/beta fold hydrolase, partial [Clostridia bacterium]|nr:alpha/beta fold hydrolase [Clostridia bacterium]
RAYVDSGSHGPVVLVIPAPIKKGYIWDLAPGQSVVRQLVRSGARVYLVAWEEPGNGEQKLGLADYGDKLLLDCLRVIAAETGQEGVFLAGHSLGGTLAVVCTLLHPERVAGLILLASPLNFGPEVDALSALIARSPPASTMSGYFGGTVPGWWLDLNSIWAAPGAFILEPQQNLLASLAIPLTLTAHLRTQRWMLDQTPLPRRLFEQVVEWLYRENRLTRGLLVISGKRLLPAQVKAPLLCVAEISSSVTPASSMRPFFDSASSQQKEWLWYREEIGVNLQHVGVLAGRQAHRELWPRIIAWLHAQWQNCSRRN